MNPFEIAQVRNMTMERLEGGWLHFQFEKVKPSYGSMHPLGHVEVNIPFNYLWVMYLEAVQFHDIETGISFVFHDRLSRWFKTNFPGGLNVDSTERCRQYFLKTCAAEVRALGGEI